MNVYQVGWVLETEAVTPLEAARTALVIQRDPDSIATVFAVTDSSGEITEVDLGETSLETVVKRPSTPAFCDVTGLITAVVKARENGPEQISLLNEALELALEALDLDV